MYLAPEGQSLAFHLGDGFCWLDGYSEITPDELLDGIAQETKTAQAEELIREMLSSGDQVPCDSIFTMAQAKGISRRTVNEAKHNIPDIQTRKIRKKWFWQLPQ